MLIDVSCIYRTIKNQIKLGTLHCRTRDKCLFLSVYVNLLINYNKGRKLNWVQLQLVRNLSLYCFVANLFGAEFLSTTRPPKLEEAHGNGIDFYLT